MTAQIFVLDDNSTTLENSSRVLADAGHQVKTTTDARHVVELIGRERPDLVILDVLMPDIDGIEICRRLRADPFLNGLPILFLSANGSPGDIAQGLDAGGDDYLVKPFNVIELLARVNALLRRAPTRGNNVHSYELNIGKLRLNLSRPEVKIGETRIALTPIEHRLLYCLMSHAGQPQPIEQLLQDVWGYASGDGEAQLVRVHIANLRTKLAIPPADPLYIHNLHGRGYLIPGTLK